MRVPLVALAIFLIAGCEDIRRFEGVWVGPVSPDPAHQQGFGDGASLTATVGTVSRREIQMTVALPQQPAPLPFEPIHHAADDALGEMRLDGDPLRSFIGFVRPPGALPFLAVVSLFAEDRIDVRIIRGPDESYGVFSLKRSLQGTSAISPDAF